MTAPRHVRPSDDFYDDLYSYLGPERGPLGEPSSEDFESTELPAILHAFAMQWNELPERFPGNPRYRLYIQSGLLVFAYAVTGQLQPDGSVVLELRHRGHESRDRGKQHYAAW